MKTLLCSFIILTTCFSVCIAATHYIKADGTGDYATIQAGINAAGNGDIVLLAAGTYTGVGNRDINFWGLPITVTSESGPGVTIIDCQSLGRGFYFHSGEGPASVVSGLTIQNGSSAYGGGIRCDASSPTITNNTITGNSASVFGGGIYCLLAYLTITGNTITGNTATEGGGIYCADSSPSITNNTITGNVATLNGGGGIYCNYSSPAITGNTITENSTFGDGGGIYCSDSSPAITSNTITGNSAAHYSGGGIYCVASSSPPITNNTITGNSASSWGGGIACYGTSPTIRNNTLSGNTAPDGGGIYCVYSSPTIENTIIAFSIQGNGVYCDSGSNPTITCCDIFGNAGGDALCGTDGGNNISVDPLFCGQVIGNYQLAENSPCAPGNSPCGELIGAWPVGCGSVASEETTWGEMKSMYQD